MCDDVKGLAEREMMEEPSEKGTDVHQRLEGEFQREMKRRGYTIAYQDATKIEWNVPEGRTGDDVRADHHEAMRIASDKAPVPEDVPCADCDAPTPWEDGGFCEDCREANEEEDAAEIGTTIRLKAGHENAAISQLEEAISVLRQLASAREKMRRLVGPIAREATTMSMGSPRDGEITVNLSVDGDRVQAALLEHKAELFEILREIHRHEAATVGAIASMISELAEED